MNGDLVHPTSTCLHTELRPVDDEVFETATFAQVLDYLGGEMLRHECYALAANQVGLEVPIVIFNNIKYGFPAIPVMVNPRIVEWGSEVAPFREGCLSIPGVYRTFERPTTVVVAYQDEKGDPQSVEADGLFARVIQHERDHCYGMLWPERFAKFGHQNRNQRRQLERELSKWGLDTEGHAL